MTDEIKKMPKVCAGAVIVNKDGKILLTRAPKWHNQLTWPGGHVEWGETIEQALKREVKEEVGLDVYDPQLIAAFEFIESDDYVKDRHVISLDYLVKTDNQPGDVKIDGIEITEYFWLTPEEVVDNPEVEATTKEDVKIYLEKFCKDKKHGLFHRGCKECEKAKSETQEFKTGWQRALADYRNLQNEIEKRKAEWAQMSEMQVLSDFLPVYENMKKAISMEHVTWNMEQENWRKGIEHIMAQFSSVLKNHGLEEIKTAGEQVDLKFHEVVGEEESDKPSGTIIKEVETGYVMGGRVVKAAKVTVSK